MTNYYVIDTNVFLCASGIATHVSTDQIGTVRAWLTRFRQDGDAVLLLDSEGAPSLTKSRILEEYQKKMTKSDVGWLAIKSKLESRNYLCYNVAFEGTAPNEYASLPDTMTRQWRDPADRKFMAVALDHVRVYPRQRCRIVNATDSDWSQYASILRQHFIEVDQLLT